MSSPKSPRKIWDTPRTEDEERPIPVPVQPSQADRRNIQRTDSRNSARSNRSNQSRSRQDSSQNSRNQVPQSAMYMHRNLSNTSIESSSLLDHRQQAQSLPRASFLAPQRRHSKSGSNRTKKGFTKQKGAERQHSQLARPSYSSSESDSGDEITPIMAKSKKTRRQSSSSVGYNTMAGRRGSDAGQDFDADRRQSVANPNYPPSIPSSIGSRRESRPSISPTQIYGSITGRDESGIPLRINMAKRVMDYAASQGAQVGDEGPAKCVSIADLPNAVNTNSDKYDRYGSDVDNSGMTDTEDLQRGRLQSRAQEDVCFPVTDSMKASGHIDYEELEDWAREQIEAKEGGHGSSLEWRHRKLSEPMLVNGRYRNRDGWTFERYDEDDRPYRFTFFSDGLASTIHSPTLYELPQEGQSFHELFTSSDTFWLDVNSPTDSEMKILSSAFGIHPLTTEDISMEEQREKVELFRNYYLVSFRSFQQDPNSEDYLEPVNMYIVVFKDGVISFHFNMTPHPANVRRRIRQLKDYITVSSDWISYALIDDIVDAFSPLISRIEYEVDGIDESVLGIDQIPDEEETDDTQANMLRHIGACRKKVMGLLRLLGNKADVVKGFSKRCNEHWDVAPRGEIGLYLGDIQDHIVTMVQNLNHYEKILSRSHSNYLAQISIEMTKVNNDTNDVLSRLTVLGSMIIPCTLVTGIWGMNVPVPGQDSQGLHWFYGST